MQWPFRGHQPKMRPDGVRPGGPKRRKYLDDFKRGEDGGDVIRVAELDGNPVGTELRLFDKKLRVEVKPHGIATLRDGVRADLIENIKN